VISGRTEVSGRLLDNNFDALRLFFASMVVVHHMGILSQLSSLEWLTHVSASFAVQAFFVVSGFLVTMSFERSSSYASYASKRIRRIAPAYIAVVTGAALALVAMSTLPAREYFTDREFWRYVLFNLGLANFAAPSLPGVFQSNPVTAINGSLWTIKIEVLFYCMVPICVLAVRRFGYSKVLISVFIASIIWKAGFNAAAELTNRNLYAELAKQLPGQMSFFVGGAWAYYRTRQGFGISAFYAALGVATYVFDLGRFNDAVEPVAITAIVYWLAICAPRLPPLGKYGDFSYGTYLYHFPLVQVTIALGLFAWSPLVGVVTVVVAVASCAMLSWRFIENPLLHKSHSHSALQTLQSIGGEAAGHCTSSGSAPK